MGKELDYLDKILNYQPLTLVERTIIECIKEKIQRLEAIDNANPSEAFMKLNTLLDRANHDEILSRKSIEFCEKWIKETQEAYDTIKQALIQAKQDKKKLNEIEKLTHLLYSKRRKIGQEYIKWCEKNNAVFNDETNMVTWVLAIKLKEILK